MDNLEQERMKIQNRILRNGASRKVAIAIMLDVDRYVENKVRLAEIDEACKIACETGVG